MREGRCMSLIEHLKQGSELKSTLSIGKLFQRFMTRSVKKLDLTQHGQWVKWVAIQNGSRGWWVGQYPTIILSAQQFTVKQTEVHSKYTRVLVDTGYFSIQQKSISNSYSELFKSQFFGVLLLHIVLHITVLCIEYCLLFYIHSCLCG